MKCLSCSRNFAATSHIFKPYPLTFILILSFHLIYTFHVVFQPTHYLAHPPLCALHVLFISIIFIKSSQQYMAKNKNFEAPHYAIFSSHLSFSLNTELNILFSNTLRLRCSVWLKYQASMPNKKATWTSCVYFNAYVDDWVVEKEDNCSQQQLSFALYLAEKIRSYSLPFLV